MFVQRRIASEVLPRAGHRRAKIEQCESCGLVVYYVSKCFFVAHGEIMIPITRVHYVLPSSVEAPIACLDAVKNTVVVSVALPGSAAGGARRAADSAGRGLGFILLSLLLLASATNAGGGHVVSPNVNGEVLQNIGVNGALLGLLLGLAQSIVVVLSVVVNDALADLRDVKDTVEQISGPVGVELGVGDSVAQTTDGGKGLADVEGEVTDDSLGGGVVAAPVTGPF